MVKKLKAGAEPKAAGTAGLLDSQMAQTVKDSAQQIWLAGLGAFSEAQGKGTKMFETLMKQGVSLQRKTQTAAEEGIGSVAGKMTAMAGEVGSKANASWDKLEAIFEQRTAKALGRLGVPTAKDVAALTQRVEALTAAVAKLGSPAASTATKPAARKAAPKQTAKPAAAVATAAAPARKRAARKAASK